MSELDRSRVIELLERLGAEDDETVLAAARELSAHVATAGVTWDDLLEPEDEDYEEEAEDDEEAEAEGEDEAAPVEETPVPADLEEDGKLIDRLLAAKGISADTRAELADLKRDIEAGEFTAMDSRYVRALAKRLGA